VIEHERLFFEGAALAARIVLPESNQAQLSSDVHDIISLCAQSPQLQEPKQLVNLAYNWLTERRTKSEGAMITEKLTDFQPSPHGNFSVNEMTQIVAIAEDEIEAVHFTTLICGARAGLAMTLPAHAIALIDDIVSLRKDIGNLKNLYRGNGIRDAAVFEMASLEYIDFRLNNPFSVLSSLSLHIAGVGAHYGRLDVKSVPTPATIAIDSHIIGQSPIQLGVVVGSHSVEGTQGIRKDVQMVYVGAAAMTSVNLTLV
jgi:hypothetical protein